MCRVIFSSELPLGFEVSPFEEGHAARILSGGAAPAGGWSRV
jgi:hypothetical protein